MKSRLDPWIFGLLYIAVVPALIFADQVFGSPSCALTLCPSTCRSIPDRCDRHSPALKELISASGALN
jgi:hypothetical protein